MTTQAIDIHTGMNVIGSDGNQIGDVAEVWLHTPTHGLVGRSTFEIADYGPISGTTTHLNSTDGFLQVRRGGAFTNADDLFVPIGDVQDVVPGEAVTVSCSLDECDSRYQEKPDVLSQSGPTGH